MKTESKHTAGPWRFGEQNGHLGVSINAGKSDTVATVYLGMVTSEKAWGKPTFDLPENQQAIANANLIAAAPELLEACEYLCEAFRGQYNVRKDFSKINALACASKTIAKAKGGAL